MNNSDILKDLMTFIPEENFIQEPEASLNELLVFEEKYKLNTSEFVEKKFIDGHVDVEDIHDWLNSYENYLFFDGDISKINKADKSTEYFPQFLNVNENEPKLSNEYIKKEEANSYIQDFASSFFSITATKCLIFKPSNG